MEVQTRNQLENKLIFLLSNTSSASTIFLNFLTKNEFNNIFRLNHRILQFMRNKPYIKNKMFYQSYLNLDKSIFYQFYCEKQYLHFENTKLFSVFQSSSLDFTKQINSFRCIYKNLHQNISYFLGDQKAAVITQNIFNILKNPCLPLPKLRRQTVGTYCFTPLQIFVAQLNWSGRIEQDQQQIFFEFKAQVFERAGEILNFFKNHHNQKLLKTIRYQREKINTYQKTKSPFINIIILLMQLIQVFSASIQSFLRTLKDSQNFYHLFIEFLVRYSAYRCSILQFEEKLNFLFVHFQQTFQCVFSNYPSKPHFGIWRMMLKKWIQKMKKFHDINEKITIYLLMKQCQLDFSSYLENTIQESQSNPDYLIFDHQIQYKIMKEKKISQIYIKQNLETFFQIQYFQQNPNFYSNFINDYTQYLTDISINQITVHWCGSTQQLLSTHYVQFQDNISDQLFQCLKYFYKVVQNLAVCKKISEQYLIILKEYLNARTMKKIMNETNEFLSDVRSLIQNKYFNRTNLSESEKIQFQCIQDWKPYVFQFDYIDGRIKFLNNERCLQQSKTQEYSMFFDLNEDVDMEALQNIVKQSDELGDVQFDKKQSLESFVSDDEPKQGQKNEDFYDQRYEH